MNPIALFVVLQFSSFAFGLNNQNGNNFPEFQKCCKNDEVLNVDSNECELIARNVTEIALYLGSSIPDFKDLFPSDVAITFPKCYPNETLTVLYNGQNDSFLEFSVLEKCFGLLDIQTGFIVQSGWFCLDQGFKSDGEFVATVAKYCRLSPELECQTRSCVRLCCPGGHFFDVDSSQCVPMDSANDDLDYPPRTVVNMHERQFYGLPSCDSHNVHNLENVSFNVEPSGNVQIQNFSFDYNHYCLDGSLESKENFSIAIVCTDKDQDELVEILVVGQKVLRVLFLVSVGFLTATFVHILMKNRHKLFGVMTLCMISMLAMFYLILAIPNFSEFDFLHTNPLLCKIEALSIQFFYLSAMCWLSSMSFNIWITFRQLRNRHPPTGLNGWRHKSFKWYALWSWGIPTLVCIVTLTMDSLPKELTSGHYLPELATSRCFLGEIGMILYFHIINFPLMLANLVMFILSSWNICCGVYADSGILESQSHKRLKFGTKIFLIMGISWIAEIISFIMGLTFEHSAKVVRISLFFDCMNALQGLTIFFAVFWNQETVIKMKSKFHDTTNFLQSGHLGQTTNPTTRNAINTNDSLPLATLKYNKKEISDSSASTTEIYHFVELNEPEESGSEGRKRVGRWFHRKSGSYQVTPQ